MAVPEHTQVVLIKAMIQYFLLLPQPVVVGVRRMMRGLLLVHRLTVAQVEGALVTLQLPAVRGIPLLLARHKEVMGVLAYPLIQVAAALGVAAHLLRVLIHRQVHTAVETAALVRPHRFQAPL
jgi:hypothetical protein